MKKTLSLILALMLLLTCVGTFAQGEPSGEPAATEQPKSAADLIEEANKAAKAEAAAAEEAFLKTNCEYSVIPADEATGQIELSYIEGITPILEVDGLKFKDMNKNGTLDVYEDWRNPIDDRVADIISQMTPKEEVGLLFCVNTQLADARQMVWDWALTCQLFNLNGTPITIQYLNNLQATAEAERLGVPMIFTSDREYNSLVAM